MMRNSPTTSRLLRAASFSFLGLAAGITAAPALAGPVLVSRESGLRASGVSGAGEINLSNGSGDFNLFADELTAGDATAARSAADQHSQPRVEGPAGAFGGAVANGSARAAVDASAPDAFSSAESGFDLVFRVEDEPARVLLEGLFGAAGDATAGVKLYDADTLQPALSDEVSGTGDSREYRGEKVLPPGTYGLSVWAFVRGTPEDSTATYSVELSLAAAGTEPPPVTPMPLPPGAWAGLGGLLAVAGGIMRLRRSSQQ